MGGGYSSLFVCLCVCVCVLPQNWYLNSIISKSKEATAFKHGNHIQNVVLYKTETFFLAKAAQIAIKFGNKKTNRTDLIRKAFESSKWHCSTGNLK